MKQTFIILIALSAIFSVQGQAVAHYGFPGESLPEIDTIPVYFLCANKESSGAAAWVFQRQGWIAEKKNGRPME
jgi:hypothetical protein